MNTKLGLICAFIIGAACGGNQATEDAGSEAGLDASTAKETSADVTQTDAVMAQDTEPDAPSCTSLALGSCGRDTGGITCSISNGTTAFGASTTWGSTFSDANGWNTGPEYYATIQFADVNGDGKADVCARDKGGVVCGLATGSGFATPTVWDQDFGDQAGWNLAPGYWSTIQFPDVNGDGKADVCGRGNAGIICALSDGTKFVTPTTAWSTDFSDALGWEGTPSYFSTISFPDLNGDGKADVCGRSSGGMRCALSNGTSFVGAPPLPVWEANFSDANGWNGGAQYYGTVQFADVDGDGKDDVCGRGLSGVYCSISNGTTGFTNLQLWDADFSDANGWTKIDYSGTIQFPDLDGDGKADICGRSPTGIACALSDGTKFMTQTAMWSSDFADAIGWDVSRYFATIQFPDLDADGKADVCGRGVGGVICALSDGTKFVGSPPLPIWQAAFSDTSAFTQEPYWGTIAFPILDVGTCAQKAQPTRPLRWIARFGP